MTIQTSPRRRLSLDDRRRQLTEATWHLVRTEGSDALSLARVGEKAGMSKTPMAVQTNLSHLKTEDH